MAHAHTFRQFSSNFTTNALVVMPCRLEIREDIANDSIRNLFSKPLQRPILHARV